MRRENKEDGVLSRRISPASSDVGVLLSHNRSSLDDAEVLLVNLAPGRKVLPLVDLSDVGDKLGVKKEEEDMWKWFVPPVSWQMNLTPPVSPPVSTVKHPYPSLYPQHLYLWSCSRAYISTFIRNPIKDTF